MMLNKRWFLTSALLLLGIMGFAQGEGLSPISVEQRQAENAINPLLKSAEGQVYIYAYDTLDVPLMDDFSIDRTRHLNANPSDSNVELDTTLYKLYVGATAPIVLNVMLDTTYLYTITIQTNPDTIIIDTAAYASTLVTIYDINGADPSVFEDTMTWPPFDVYDTIGGGIDTTFFDPPDIFQDSVQIYSVEADTNFYIMGLTQTPLILWQDDDVLVNGTYPVDPPTVGVATFDGLERLGIPYNFSNPCQWGIADHLTSVPINLEFQPSDSVYLSFYYQTIGLSGDDLVQEEDSLLLEFYSIDDESWDPIWSHEYIQQEDFVQVMIPITESKYLKNGFQFRFKNYATLCGSLDHWHLDYVRLAENRTYDDTIIVDVAYLYEESTLLHNYTAMPWGHFEAAPESYMEISKFLDQKNLDVNDRFITYGMLTEYEGIETDNFVNGINSSGNASSTFTSSHLINEPPNNFVYDTALADTCAYFDVAFYTNTTPDINRYNDTVRFTQNFTTYYAYDDGSAEAGYWLNVAGAKLAYEFNVVGGDSMRAVRMYFNPVFEDPSGGSFLITIWSDLDPANVIHQNFSFSSPQYQAWGENAFIEYPLDSAIWVENTFYVGWVQTTADKMNIGFDRNNNNGNKIFFNVTNQFFPTSFEGSLMMRPVFISEKDDPWLGIDDEQIAEIEFELYPNPTSGEIWISLNGQTGQMQIELLDLQGRKLREFTNINGNMNLGDLRDGVYLLKVSDPIKGASGIRRIVIQH